MAHQRIQTIHPACVPTAPHFPYLLLTIHQLTIYLLQQGWFKGEIVPVPIKVKGKEVLISEDEEYKKVNFDKIPSLKTVFKKDGTMGNGCCCSGG